MARGPKTPEGRAKSKANLKKFEKGKSGNPGGRPKYGEISKAIRHILDLPSEKLARFVPDTMAEKIAMARINEAAKRSGLFDAQFVADRAEGKATATIISDVNLNDASFVVDLLKPPADHSPEQET